MLRIILVCFWACTLFFSCRESREEQVARLVDEWSGKEILFPKRPVFTRQGIDTVDFHPERASYKVLVYVDSTGCMSCRLQLPRWKELMAYTDSVVPGKVAYLFYLCPKSVKEMRYVLRRDLFQHPVCIDKEGCLDSLNRFPAEDAFQTFLLGTDNKVLALGNPVHNPKVKELYLSLVMGKKSTASSRSVTKVEIDRPVVDVGSFPWKEAKTDSFVLRNVGNAPLVVHDMVTNCGCLQMQYGKEPVRPGGELVVHLRYKADHREQVDKLVRIYANVENETLVVRLKGRAE